MIYRASVVNARSTLWELRVYPLASTAYAARRKPKDSAVIARRWSSRGAPKWMTESAERINKTLPDSIEKARRLMVSPDHFLVLDRARRKADGFDLHRELAEMGALLTCSGCGRAGVLTWQIPDDVYRLLRRSTSIICPTCRKENP